MAPKMMVKPGKDYLHVLMQRIRLAWRFRREPLRWRYQAFGRRKPILKLQFLNSLIQYMQTSSASTMVCAMYEANMLAVCAHNPIANRRVPTVDSYIRHHTICFQ